MHIRIKVSIRDWQERVHANAREHGWWDDGQGRALDRGDPLVLGAKLALIHSEVSEALEELRRPDVPKDSHSSKPLGFDVELADIVIRVLDLAAACDIDLQDAIERKHEYNKMRPNRHGGKRL